MSWGTIKDRLAIAGFVLLGLIGGQAHASAVGCQPPGDTLFSLNDPVFNDPMRLGLSSESSTQSLSLKRAPIGFPPPGGGRPSTPYINISPSTSTDGNFTVTYTGFNSPCYFTLRNTQTGQTYTTTSTSRSFTNQSNGNYSFQVRACNNSGCSSYSSTRTVTVTRPQAPGTPSSISAPSNDNDGTFTVSWGTASGSPTRYELQQQVNGGSWSGIYSGSNRSLTRSNQGSGSYRFRVRACHSQCGSYRTSNTTTVTIASSAPNWANDVKVTVSDHTPSATNFTTHDHTVGAVAGEGGVSGGQASYSIPIAVPPGRAGMQPNVSVNYSSSAGNSTLGMGFSLSAGGAISRCGQTLAHDGRFRSVQYSQTQDRLCWNGQRLIPVSGSYGASGTVYRTELDNFAKVTQVGSLNGSTTYFQVQHRNGQKDWYGSTTGSRVRPHGAPAVLSWRLTRTEDTSQNSMRYHYSTAAHGEVLLRRIHYTGVGDQDGDRYVELTYQDRNDVSSSYLHGGLTRQTKRLRYIDTYASGSHVKRYEFGYMYSGATTRSLLHTVTECGFDGATQQCLPATTFSWHDADASFVLEPVGYRTVSSTVAGNEGGSITPRLQSERFIEHVIPQRDVNGDGTPDWPTWYTDAEGVHQGDHTQTTPSCRRVQNGSLLCADADINRDGKTDRWRLSGGTLQITYDETESNWRSTSITVTDTVYDGVYAFSDLNADGWPDLIMSQGQRLANGPPRTLKLHLHSGNVSAPYTSSSVTMFTQAETNPSSARYTNDVQLVGDIDGDGLPDLLVSQSPLSARFASHFIFTRLASNGTPTFSTTQSVTTHRNTLPAFDPSAAEMQHFDYFMDVNGDGLSDWLAWVGRSRLWLSINQGDGDFAPWQNLGSQAELEKRNIPVNLTGEWEYAATPKFAHALRQFDIDADGRPELLIPDELIAPMCIDRAARNGSVEVCGNNLYRPYSIGDQEKVLDVAKIDGNIYRYKALRFVEDQAGAYRGVTTSTPIVASATQSAGVDGFGNGLTDMVFTYGCLPGESCRLDTVNNQDEMRTRAAGVYINRNRGAASGNRRYEPVDMLKQVETGVGHIDEWTYRPLSSKDGSFSHSQQPFYTADHSYLSNMGTAARAAHFHFASSMYVVAEHRRSNGLGNNTNATQFRYKGAMYNWQGRGFQGFRTIITEDVTAGLVSRSDFHQIFPIAGQMHQVRQWELSDATNDNSLPTAINETNYQWRFWPNAQKNSSNDSTVDALTDSWTLPSNTPIFVHNKSTESIHRTLAKQETHRTKVTSEYDNYGRLTNQSNRYQEPANRHVVSSSTATDYDNSYINSNWWLDKPNTVTTTTNPISSRNGLSISTSQDTTKTVTVTYNDWDTAKRLPENITTTPSTGKSVTVATVYNSRGLPTSVTTSSTGETSRTTSTTYTSDGYFPRTVTNALNHVIETDTDERFGVPNWVEDANDQRVSTFYDAFGRAIETVAEDVSQPVYTSLQWCNPCSENSDAVYKIITEQEGAPTSVAFVDKLGRTVQTRTQSFESDSTWVVQGVRFNARGLKTFESVPAFNSVSSDGTTYNDYDVLGRLTEKTTDQTDGQELVVEYEYEQGTNRFRTDITVNNTLTMSRTYNGLDQLIHTEDAEDGTTSYAYDGAGNPIVIRDANSNDITAAYNALGQKLYVNDPNMGNKTFVYTGFGEIDSETDANGDTTKYIYDRLGRMTERRVNNVVEARFYYDRNTNLQGLPDYEVRVGLSSGQQFRKTYGYDSYTRPVSVTTQIDNDTFVTETQYDSYFGRVKGLVYPNGLTVAYTYNDRGYPVQTRNAASGYVYREITAADVWGNATESEIAAGTATNSYQYDAVTGQMRGLELRNGSGLIHKQSYDEYDVYGNLRRTDIRVPSLSSSVTTERYIYDDLHRLTDNTRTNASNISYTYDAVGNLLSKSDYANTYHYAGAKPNAVSRVDRVGGGSMSYRYDNNGNRTHENNVETIRYNAFNKPTWIRRNGTELRFSYGADQMRYKQVNVTRGQTTLYVDKLFEKITDSSETKLRLFIDDVAVLTVTNPGSNADYDIGFTHRDRLGSTVAITDAAGVITETQSFDPFGKPRTGNGRDKTTPIIDSDLTTRGFTDHEHLDDVRLIHMNGRGYDYNTGQFLSVDPFVQGVGSQGLNPYSYIMNNPLAGTDPSGYHIKLTCRSENGCSSKGGTSEFEDHEHSKDEKSSSGSNNSKSDNGKQNEPVTITGSRTEGTPPPSTIGDQSSRESSDNTPNDNESSVSSAGKLAAIGKIGVEIAAASVPFGEAALMAARGDFRGAAVSAVTEGAIAVASTLFTGGAGYLAYKAWRYGKVVARAKNIDKIRTARLDGSVKRGTGFGPNDPQVRLYGEWSDTDLKDALRGRSPKGLGSPDLHHADQMPGSAIHEILPSVHRGNKRIHPNKYNQGVTPKMRQEDKQLHWWYRAREQGADQKFPDMIYNNN